MVSMLTSSVVDCGFCHTKDYIIGICCFYANHAVKSRRKGKDWLASNHDNVSEWSDMSTCRQLFQ